MNASAQRYPTRAKIKQVVDGAKEAGVKVGGVECWPDGAIRVFSERMAPPAPASAYDSWKRRKEVS